MNKSRLRSLDGWRALCIVLVLGIHCKRTPGFPPALNRWIDWWFDGDMGVRFFFVISGFLITWLMLVEQSQTGRINLRHFYIRRALRILPVYGAVLGTLALLEVFTNYRQSAAEWLGNFTFTTNFLQNHWPNGHLWSLAIEEQFYFIWPGLLALVLLPRGTWICVAALLVPAMTSPVFRVLARLHAYPDFLQPLFGIFSTFMYYDSLAYGCLAALLLARMRPYLEEVFETRPWACVATGSLFILVPYVIYRLGVLGFVLIPFLKSSQAIGFCILLLHSVIQPEFPIYRPLNLPAVRALGVLSYSIYIWQQLFCARPETYGVHSYWWLVFPTWMIGAVATAALSYFCLERPLFRLRSRFR